MAQTAPVGYMIAPAGAAVNQERNVLLLKPVHALLEAWALIAELDASTGKNRTEEMKASYYAGSENLQEGINMLAILADDNLMRIIERLERDMSPYSSSHKIL